MRVTWLADKMRDAGLDVVEVQGWKTRGSDTFDPVGIVIHHTAGPKNGDYPSLNTVISGNSTTPGPLSNLGLGRSGKVYVIAAGRCNHAGTGVWKNVSGNSKFFGIEAENTGLGEIWPAAQLDAYIRMCAVLCREGKISTSMIACHREYATPPGRKPDPRGIDGGWFRNEVQKLLNKPLAKTDAASYKDSTPFFLVNPSSRFALDLDGSHNGAKLQQWPLHGRGNQRFVFRTKEGSAEFGIVSLESGKALDVPSETLDQNGSKIQLWDWHGGANQLWKVTPFDNGMWHIASVANGRNLDVPAQDIHTPGADLQLWDHNGHIQQQFFVVWAG